MTDHMIHADNLARNIRTVVDLATAPGNHYTKADVIDHLEALLPKPPTLADELSEFAESLLAGASVSDVELQLIRFADRVETLEQERDHVAKSWKGCGEELAAVTRQRDELLAERDDFADRAEELEQERDEARKDSGDAWRGTDKAEAAHAQLLYEKNRLAEELAEARVQVDRWKGCADTADRVIRATCDALGAGYDTDPVLIAGRLNSEIARLRAREIPDGWRIADHPEHGAVLVAESPDEDGAVHYVRLGTGLLKNIYRGWDSPNRLSFRDEAPAPQPEMDAQ